jgi:single-stranded DNA-binding protein
VNTVSLIGRLVEKPTLHTGETGAEECRLRLAVPRRGHAGELEPGVLYLEALTIGPQARECAARLGARASDRLSGRLEVESAPLIERRLGNRRGQEKTPTPFFEARVHS